MDAYPPPTENRHYLTSTLLISVLFFVFGFVTWLGGRSPFLSRWASRLDNLRAFHGVFGYRVGQIQLGRAPQTGSVKG